MWDSTDILKTLGILFIIVMVWYIVFIIFQENKKFLLSLTSSEENNSIKMPNLFKKIFPGVKEGMSDDQAGEYEKKIKETRNGVKYFLKVLYEIDSDPETDQSKLKPDLVLKRLEANLEWSKLIAGMYGIESVDVIEKLNSKEEGEKIARNMSAVLDLIKCCKIGISFLKESKEETENEGAGGGGGMFG